MIGQNGEGGMEQALAQMERESETLLRAAKETVSALKKAQAAAGVGDLVKLRQAMQEAEQTTHVLRDEFDHIPNKWELNESEYLASQAFQEDLLAMGREMGVEIFEHEGTLYSYPVFVRVFPHEKAVTIDRSRETRLRPSVLVKRLKEIQNRPRRFKPQVFLDALFSAYSLAVGVRGRHLMGTGVVVPLIEIHELLTLLPGQASQYTRQEFARDVYFLDKSGISRTKKGHRVNFHASTGIRDASKTLSVMSQGGRVRTYYGTSFLNPCPEA